MKSKKHMNLFMRMFLGLFSVFTCISILITSSFCVYYKQHADQSFIENVQQISANNAKSIASAFSQIEMAVNAMNNENSGLQEKLLLYNGDSKSLVDSFYQSLDLFSNYINIALRSFTTRYHVYFFLDPSYEIYDSLSPIEIDKPLQDGMTWIYSDVNVCNEEWYQMALENPNQSHWLTLVPDRENLYMVRGLQYMTVENSKVDRISLGIILIRLDMTWIQEMLDVSGMESNTIFWLTDETGNVLFSSDSNPVTYQETPEISGTNSGSPFLNLNGKKYAKEITNITSELNLITLTPSETMWQNYIMDIVPFLLLFVVVLLIGVFFSIVFSHRMTRDILYLAQHMRTNTLSPVIPAHSPKDEDISFLFESYNVLVTQVQELIQKEREYAESIKESELNLLQVQINPHFICNSLTSIYNVAMLHNERSIADALSNLCGFLRYNVSAPNIDVPLQRELDMLEYYISLQNFLYNDRISFDYDSKVDAEQTFIPKMLLQPLVENCIMHNSGSDFIEISIVCAFDQDGFWVTVEDNGCANDIDAINRILDCEVDNSKLRNHGFGITNVNQRIKMKYGNNYSLHYERRADGGVAALIKLPASIAVSAESESFRIS